MYKCAYVDRDTNRYSRIDFDDTWSWRECHDFCQLMADDGHRRVNMLHKNPIDRKWHSCAEFMSAEHRIRLAELNAFSRR